MTMQAKHVLFFDDQFLASTSGLKRTLHQPVKWEGNPIVRPDRPWEGKCVIIWGSVIWDPADDLFKMWYQTHNPIAELPNRTLLCYATSRDGVHWEKPVVGLHDFEGSTENNIVYRPAERFDSATVILDPFDPPPEGRFKMVLQDKGRLKHIRFQSPDGLHWEELGPIAALENAGDRHSLCVDPLTGQWRIYFKRSGPRTVHLAVSDNFTHWTDCGEVLAPAESDPPDTEFYGMVAFVDGSWRLGMLETFKVLERRLNAQLVRLDEQGRPTRYRPGQVFLDHGAWGQWDSAWAFSGNCGPIRVGEELRFYYQGRPTLHWSDPPNGTGHFGAIGLARLRADGYVSLDGTGTLTTNPIPVTGRFLCINGNAANGEIRLELLDEDGSPLPGMTAADHFPLTCDATYFKQAWGRKSNLSDLVDRRVRIRATLRNASLYSMWFCNKPG